jgi:hypothetical protein
VAAGVSGKLVGVDILPQRGDFNPPTESTLFFVNVGAPWQSDANDFEQVITVPATGVTDWFYVDVSSANIFLQAGQSFVWGTRGVNGGLWLHGHSQVHYPGQLWIDAPPLGVREQELFGSHADLCFRSYMQIVPEPRTLAFGLVCLASVAATARRTSDRGGARARRH